VRAAVCTAYGPPEVLRVVERAIPVCGKNEVCIRVRATAVSSSDCYVRGLALSATYRLLARLVLGWNGPRQPVLGMVLSGEVVAVGRDVSRFEVGDRVFGMDNNRFGTYAQYVCWPEIALLARRPAGVTDEAAAALPYGGLLASHLLRKAAVRPGSAVLVYGASGAVGTSTAQLARHLGAEVTAVCSGGNAALVTSLGASRVIDYTREDFTRQTARYDAILDTVGKRKSSAALKNARRVLAPGGSIVSVDDGAPGLRQEDLVLLGRLVEEGELRAVVDRTYMLGEIVEAHRYVDGGHKRGNVVITVP
jgi:NADPH:quinone reductase-like Zn-dependent oxidoreductase